MCAMGMLQRIRDALAMTAAVPELEGPKFAIGPESIPPEFYGLKQYDSNLAPKPRVARRLAIQVPAVLRGRNLICTPIGGLSLKVHNRAGEAIPNELFEQPERDVPRSVTMTYLVEDLLFEQTAWWRVTEWRGPNPAAGSANPFNYPKHVRRLEPRSVDPRKDGKVYVRKDGSVQGEAWEHVPDAELIRFDSPTDGVLTAGAGAISTLLMLDNRAYNSANNPVPEGYFTPKDGVDPFDEEDPEASEEEQALLYTAAKFLADWRTKRLTETTAWVPGGVDYNQLAWDPEKLQLAEARQHAVLEIARLMGLDPEDVAVSTTSRTYFNAETKRQDRIDFVLGMFLNAIADRLSMGDITPRGQRAAFDVDAFTMTDTKTRLETYEIGLRIGLWTLPELRAKEGLPPLTAAQLAEIAAAKAPPPPQIPQGDNVTPINRRDQRPALVAGNGQQFDDAAAELQLQATSGPEFRVDLQKRTISGLALPYGGAQAWNQGELYEFAPGSVTFSDPKRIKVYIEHDSNRVIGYATKLEDRPEGLFAELKIANIPEGDHALLMASEGLWDGLSSGFRAGGRFTRQDDGVLLAAPGGAPLKEISLCPVPAFDDARVTAVALSADNERNTMKCTKCDKVHAAGVVACDPAAVAAFTASTQAGAGQPGEVQLSGELTGFDPVAFQEQLANAIGPAFANLLVEAQQTGQLPGQREVIAAGNQQQFQVTEELPYRFDGSTAGEHCFTDDLRDSWSGSGEAKQRLETFMEEAHQQFAVTTTNVAALNPVQNRPELYVPSLEYTRPLFELATTGTLDNITPFTVPKFSSASGLVGPHTQGVEPTPGAFAATVQTVTPSAISGKVEINREVWDQGGNPQTDTIVWREMQNAYYEAAEVGIATMLNALAAATLYSGAEINLAGAVNSALDDAISNILTDLQFARGGNRYTAWAADAQLYKALVNAKDTTNRKLYPMLGPSNANGQVEARNQTVNVNGQQVRPAWALSSGIAANAQHSYAFVPASVWAWLSAPKRFTFEYQVKSVDMAVWGYTGSAVLRNSDVARLDYTTADV